MVPEHCKLLFWIDEAGGDVARWARPMQEPTITAVGMHLATYNRLRRGGYIDRVELKRTPKRHWPPGARGEDVIAMLYGKPVWVLDAGVI